MTPEQIDRVFGRGRLKMVTGEHVEVYREAVAPGERRRYTKRFLNTPDGDFGQWTEREWRILARLIGHGITCVPDVVQVDRGRLDGAQLVQTYDAGATVDQWATLLPVTRDGRVYGHVFEDCAHWWALAHHCLLALNVIHPLELVHLDIKGDNVCIPYTPISFDPNSEDLRLQPVFGQLALIDFAFALISRASLTMPLPIGWQKDYDYQSPRLLAALEAGRNGDLQLTRELDWRCDFYSLAAMLKRYLPEAGSAARPPREAGWTPERYDAAKALILRIREIHDGELPREHPHAELVDVTAARLFDEDLARSLEQGWTFAREAIVAPTSLSPLTPVTLLAPPVRVVRSGRTAVTALAPGEQSVAVPQPRTPAIPAAAAAAPAAVPAHRSYARASAALLSAVALAAVGAALWYSEDRSGTANEDSQTLLLPETAGDTERAVPRAPVPSDETAPPSVASAESANATEETPAQESAAGESRQEGSAHRAPASSAPVATNAKPANAPVLEPAQRETPAASKAQSSIAESRTPAAETRKPALSAKQAAAAQRAAEKAARREAVLAQRAAQSRVTAPKEAKESKETKEFKERIYAPWAALEPPAWALSSYRGKGPGVPRGAMPAETRTQPAAESAPAAPTPVPTVQRVEVANSNPQPAPAATSSASSLAPAAQPTSADARPASTNVQPASPPTKLALAEPPRIVPVPPSASPARVTSAVNADRVVQEDYGALGRQTLQEAVPRIAARAEPQVARVLGMAASAYHLLEERAVAQASRAARVEDADALPLSRMTAASDARRLNDEALAAIRSRRDVREALDLQLRAFGANPRDPEVAGNLAALYLKVTPAQPQMARQLALVALAARAPQYHSARMEDWNTFAIASALSGREADARNALYVTLALTADVDMRCIAALNAVATYGDRLRKPVEAMFYRLHTQGRGIGSQACAWPPNGSLVSRMQ